MKNNIFKNLIKNIILVTIFSLLIVAGIIAKNSNIVKADGWKEAEGGWKFQVTGNWSSKGGDFEVMVYSYSGDATEITASTIPEYLNTDYKGTYKVKYIRGDIFANNTNIVSVSIPEQFEYSWINEEIKWDFSGCTNLESVYIPKNVMLVDNAFQGCDNLKEIVVAEDNEYYIVENGILYNKGKTRLMKVIPNADYDTTIDLPEEVGLIYADAFSGCDRLEKVVISKNVGYIPAGAFKNLTNLKQVVLPDSINTIYEEAFSGCSSLETITLPSALLAVKQNTFSDCTSLKEIVIPNNVKVIESWAFCNCAKLETITLPSDIKAISDGTFKNCASLKEIIISDSVTDIGEYAFSGCASLEEITIPNSVTQLGEYAFSGCTSLKELVITDSITKIGSSCFENCTSLEILTINSNMDKLFKNTFMNCSQLKVVAINGQIKTLGKDSFKNCGSIETLTLSDSIEDIGDIVFEETTILKVIGNRGTYAESWAAEQGIEFADKQEIIAEEERLQKEAEMRKLFKLVFSIVVVVLIIIIIIIIVIASKKKLHRK